MENIAEQSLASIVTKHHEAAIVLEKYHLDFCCNGKRTLAEACRQKGLSYEQITKEILEQEKGENKKSMPFENMNEEELISYILVNHHFYVKQSMPVIHMHIEKVANKHGKHYPYMIDVLHLFNIIREEMTHHMQKEEQVLFPRIKKVAEIINNTTGNDLDASYLTAPIEMMEHEHDQAGSIMFKIRELTNNYTAPEDACTTFKLCLAELKEFEEDLHRHVHLENNILFPKATQRFAVASSN